MEDSRKDKKDDEKGLLTSSPHVDKEKGKEDMVYNEERKKERGRKKVLLKSLHWDISEETLGINYTSNSNLFTLKPNILTQDQTSFLSCTL